MRKSAVTHSGVSISSRCKKAIPSIFECYLHSNSWLGLALGRKNMMRRSDIANHPFPDHHIVLAALSRLAVISEEAIGLLYTQRADSLHHLHSIAENLYRTLCAWGKDYGISSEAAGNQRNEALTAMASLILHSGKPSQSLAADYPITENLPVYFHTILLVFRPFMVAESAISVDGRSHHSSELWLRQACRRATNTAQDAIFFVNNLYEVSIECRVGHTSSSS
jgi:hypothetical protein